MTQRKFFRRFTALALVLFIFIIQLPSFGQAADFQYNTEYLQEVEEFIKEYYLHDVTDEQLMKGAVKGLFYNLDDYSEYYTKDEFDKLIEDVSGSFVGIGIYMGDDNGHVTVFSPIKDGPAYKAGLKAGDIIVSVDGKDVTSYSSADVSDLIKGKIGTKVKLGIKRNDSKDTLYFNITRDEVKVNPVSYDTVNKSLGYLNISQFNDYTVENVDKALNYFDQHSIKNLIIDLRNNPGGSVDQVVDVLKKFIPAGSIVHIKYKDGTIQTYSSSLKTPKYKLAVLINENSASASEIFAGAIKDRKVGTLVGVTTYGKGVVQEIIPLDNGDGIKLTIAEYLTPNKISIDGKGITPDIVVKNTDPTKDLQMEKAISLFK